MSLTRKEDWPERLAAFVESRRQTPFAWGQQDCCMFACDAVQEITGTDIAAEFRGKYTSLLTAARILKPLEGVEGAMERAAELFGMEECKTPAFAQRGFVVHYDTPQGPALGVCLGHVHAFAGPKGITFLPFKTIRRAWRV